MKTLLITATGSGTGKTAITLALGGLARDRGMSVGYMKPKGTRLQSHVGKVLDRDPLLARTLLDVEAALETLEPVVYSPAFVENAVRESVDPAVIRQRIAAAFDDLAADRDLMLVEGAGDIWMGGVVDLTDPEIADLIDAEVILVAAFERLEDLDGLLAAIDDIGDRLAGVVFNRVSDAALDRLQADAIPYLEGRGYPVLGVLPRRRELAGVTVDELVAELGGDRLTDGGGDAFVERFLVGAMGGDEALRQFRRTRNAAVITGGDRAEIHAAAIEASGVECLVVTGGHRPSASVLGRAARANFPVVMVTTNTLNAIERAEAIVRGGRTQDEATVGQMRRLLEDHADVDVILGT